MDDGQSAQGARGVPELWGQAPGGGSRALLSREVVRGRLSAGGMLKEGTVAGQDGCRALPKVLLLPLFSVPLLQEILTQGGGDTGCRGLRGTGALWGEGLAQGLRAGAESSGGKDQLIQTGLFEGQGQCQS